MILVAGSANIDFVTRVPHIPAPGETVLGPGFTLAPGGKGANQAVACGRAGGQVAFFGALGQDQFAATLRQSMKDSGVEDLTLDAPTSTGAAFISVSAAGENAITVASGANATLTPGQAPDLGRYQWLVLQLEIPLPVVSAFAQAARRQGVKVVLNAAPAQTLPEGLLANVDVLIVNEGELAALSTAKTLDEQLTQVRALGPQTVIVTLGERGSVAVSGQNRLEVAAHRVKVADTTGAGDTFTGVLVAALDEGLDLEKAVARANVAAALACTKAGAQPSMPKRAEILAAQEQGQTQEENQ